jgi:hypothetical protein
MYYEQRPLPYLRPSKKQLAYLTYLYAEAGEVNKSLYTRFSLPMAGKEIKRLKAKVKRHEEKSNRLKQLELL